MEVTIKINGQALSVEVSVDVYECLDRADHKEENLAHEKRRHWDIREFDEYISRHSGTRLPRNAGAICLPHGNTGRAYGRAVSLYRGPAAAVPALRAGHDV